MVNPRVAILRRFGIQSVTDLIRKSLLSRPYNPYELYKEYLNYLRVGRLPREEWPKFIHFWRTHIYPLKKLGLIRPIGKTTSATGRRVTLYAIVPGKEDSPIWAQNPQRVLAERKRWKPTHLGKRRYRRRVMGVPPLPRGRPRRR